MKLAAWLVSRLPEVCPCVTTTCLVMVSNIVANMAVTAIATNNYIMVKTPERFLLAILICFIGRAIFSFTLVGRFTRCKRDVIL